MFHILVIIQYKHPWVGEGTEEEAHQGHQVEEPYCSEGGGGSLGPAVVAKVH